MTDFTWLSQAGRQDDWSDVEVTVAGLGTSGFAAADALLRVGAHVTVIEAAAPSTSDIRDERSQVLQTLGARVLMGVPDDYRVTGDLLVPSPGLAPRHRWITGSTTHTIWSGEQLAWQLRPEGVPWLTVTGTNGKTTTVQMVDQILTRAGYASVAAGNIGQPMTEAVFTDPAPQVFVVELSSFQLHFTRSIAAHTAAILNIARDHVDWHGSLGEYAADKARIYQGAERAIVYNQDDAQGERLAAAADVRAGCRAIGFTLHVPGRSMVGVVDGVAVDRAFASERERQAVEVVPLDALPVTTSTFVADALAAIAITRSFGASIAAVRSALTSFTVDEHRGETVALVAGVRYVDNSKATNVHAADGALAAEASVVWIAGGLAKGGTFDDLFRSHRHHLRAVVLIGADQDLLADAARRHAPDVPVISVPPRKTDPMAHAVSAAAAVAHAGDTVLLAPACASMDQFADYRARGRAFAAAVAHLRR